MASRCNTSAAPFQGAELLCSQRRVGITCLQIRSHEWGPRFSVCLGKIDASRTQPCLSTPGKWGACVSSSAHIPRAWSSRRRPETASDTNDIHRRHTSNPISHRHSFYILPPLIYSIYFWGGFFFLDFFWISPRWGTRTSSTSTGRRSARWVLDMRYGGQPVLPDGRRCCFLCMGWMKASLVGPGRPRLSLREAAFQTGKEPTR